MWFGLCASIGAEVDPLERALYRQDLPGAAFAVVQPGADGPEDGPPDVLVGGIGRRVINQEQAPGADTVFEVASLGKPVFAYAVMLLVQDGVLELDRPLTEYHPEPWVTDERGREITARMVLSHSSGLARRAQLPPYLAQDPGERFLYSNNAYQYLQAVVEHITGQTVSRLMETRVFGPLGMERSAYVWEPRFEADFAPGHDERRRPLDKWRPGSARVSYSLHTTAWDLGVFLASVLHPEAVGAPLGASSVDVMLAPEIGVEHGKGGWALGWGVRELEQGTEIYHDGRSPGFDAYLWGLREPGLGVVVLTNGSGSSRVLMETILAVLTDPRADD